MNPAFQTQGKGGGEEAMGPKKSSNQGSPLEQTNLSRRTAPAARWGSTLKILLLAVALPALFLALALLYIILAPFAPSATGKLELTANKLALALIGLSALMALAAGWIILRSTRQAQPQPTLRGTVMNHQAGGPASNSSSAVQEASQRLVAVQESVRREMADYLHGHVQSKLLALSLSLGMCQKMLDQDPAHAYRMLERIQDELQRLQDEDLQQVSRELYPAIVKMGLVPAVRSLVSRFSDMLEIDLTIDQKVFALDAAGGARLPEGQRLGVYRIAEEALNNVLKHANARQVQVSLTCNAPEQLVLSVVDDGRGFDLSSVSTCHGLVMMADYAEAIGGKTQITSSPGRGATVRLTLLLSPTDLPALASRGGGSRTIVVPFRHLTLTFTSFRV